MAGSRTEPSVPRDQSCPELFREHDIGRIVRRKIVTLLPYPGEQYEVSIPGNAKVQQVTDGLIGAARRDHALLNEAAEHLGDFKIQQMRRMQSLITGADSSTDSLARRRLKKPVDCSGCVQNDHRAWRSSRTS